MEIGIAMMPTVAEAEKERRRHILASSEGSLAMEGQSLDAETAELSRRYAEGELSLEQFGELIEQHVASVVARLGAERAVVSAV